ncbi:MAG: Rrf2 family transcriptional regulator [Verrucomicrobia bacterium]|nr:Rrf2 family transcriptional regulator [Verrucomicrobiota bacterium]
MNVSQKCQYALRAVFELSKRAGQGPVRIGEVADAQAIPPRFLEIILGQLKSNGYVESRRGIQGGYQIAVDPSHLTVGDLIRFVDGPFEPVKCLGAGDGAECRMKGRCAFVGLWRRAQQAVENVFDTTTFTDLIEEEGAGSREYVPNYCI